MKILVSACLLGQDCKYNGGNNYSEKVSEYIKGHDVVSACPEVAGGLVTGSTGFVGGKIMEVCKDVVASPSLRDATLEKVKRIIDESGADVIIHTAAISDIGECQKDPEASHIANVEIPILLAKASEGRKLICFSSDQVYSGLDDVGP
nr:2-thiouracil desulfurase family protein [Oribacterium sp.]